MEDKGSAANILVTDLKILLTGIFLCQPYSQRFAALHSVSPQNSPVPPHINKSLQIQSLHITFLVHYFPCGAFFYATSTIRVNKLINSRESLLSLPQSRSIAQALVLCFRLTVSAGAPTGSQPPAPAFNRCDGTVGPILARIKNTQAPVAVPGDRCFRLCLLSMTSLVTGAEVEEAELHLCEVFGGCFDNWGMGAWAARLN